ncbi:spore germination protein, partial [Alkalihalophilus lindianensis]
FLRLIGLLISLFLPGFWIALSSYNVEQIPYPLLATIATSRIGLPFPGPLEAFLMLVMFELFREAGERLPKAVGQTISVVGGIGVGDAAIRAG